MMYTTSAASDSAEVVTETLNINDVCVCHKQIGYTLSWFNPTVNDMTVSDGATSVLVPSGENVVFVATDRGWRFPETTKS